MEEDDGARSTLSMCPGVNPVLKAIGGDTWRISANLHDPMDHGSPATPDNTLVSVVLAETQFDTPIWKGEWYSGVTPDRNRRGLAWIEIPNELTKSLRRGSYAISARVSDLLRSVYETEVCGNILVEYTTASDQHSIPYKDGTSSTSENQTQDCSSEIYRLKTEVTAESEYRKAADTSIMDRIESESSARRESYESVKSEIENEAELRASADASIEANAKGLADKARSDAEAYADTVGVTAVNVSESYTDGKIADVEKEVSSKVSDDDPRLSDSRDPNPHTHPTSEITGLDKTIEDMESSCKAYTDGKCSDTLSSANSHADTIETSLAGRLDLKMSSSSVGEEWNSGTEYSSGDNVVVDGVMYASTADGNVGHMVAETDWWQKIQLMSAGNREFNAGNLRMGESDSTTLSQWLEDNVGTAASILDEALGTEE